MEKMFVLVFAFVCYGFASLDDSVAEKLSESSGSDKELTVISSGSDVENVDEAEIIDCREGELELIKHFALYNKYSRCGYRVWCNDFNRFPNNREIMVKNAKRYHYFIDGGGMKNSKKLEKKVRQKMVKGIVAKL